MTASEKFVADLCEKSFLPFWSFPNPLGKKGKELCDVLVICQNHIIILSVKDITVSSHPSEEVQYDRWVKKAIHESIDQIYGAERFLETITKVHSKNRTTTIKLPEKDKRIIHRVAIAFGSKPEFPLPTGDFGKGFVHVFDEKSTWTILNELDTITDFTNYLVSKERFIDKKNILIPTEADFLAFYIDTGLVLPYPADFIATEAGLWESYQGSKEYSDWKRDIQVSFFWDDLVRRMYEYHIDEIGVSEQRRQELEESVRTINLESRINRIELASLIKDAIDKNVSARMIPPLQGNNHTYVFIPLSDKNWHQKEKELLLRCIVAKVKNLDAEIVIGVSMGSNSKGESYFDVCYLNIPEPNEEFLNEARKIQEELGYFKNVKMSHSKDLRK